MAKKSTNTEESKEKVSKRKTYTREEMVAKAVDGHYRKYDTNNYTTVTCLMPKDFSDKLAVKAREVGLTKTSFIIKAIENEYKRQSGGLNDEVVLEKVESLSKQVDMLTQAVLQLSVKLK